MHHSRSLLLFLLSALTTLAQTPIPAQQLRAAADYSKAEGGLTFLVWQNGQLIFEEAHNGGSTNEYYELASGTKSFAGLIAASACADGFLTWDEQAADTLTEWKADPRKARITVRMLLNLTSGLTPAGVLAAPTYAAAVAAPAETEPGSRFVYDPVHFQAFGELMRRKLAARGGGSPVDYLKARLLDRIGVRIGNWRNGPDGNPLLPQGGQFSAREWIKVGEFMRNDGRWNGVQVLPAEFIQELRKPGVVNPAYGLTWWLNQPIESGTIDDNDVPPKLQAGGFYPGGPTDLIMAAGMGNQRLYIVPGLNLVVVRQAPVFGTTEFTDAELLTRLLPPTPASQFVNLSTRGRAGADSETMIAGFVITGTRSKTVLVRAAGPALTPFGVSGALADPVLRLHDGGGQLRAENDNWGAAPNAAEVAQAFAQAGAFPFPSDSQDAALLLRLTPGAYTAQVSPATGPAGVALVEVYQLPGD